MNKAEVVAVCESNGWSFANKKLLKTFGLYDAELSLRIKDYGRDSKRYIFHCSNYYFDEGYSVLRCYIKNKFERLPIDGKEYELKVYDRPTTNEDIASQIKLIEAAVGAEDKNKRAQIGRSDMEINRYGGGIFRHLTQLAIDGNETKIKQLWEEFKVSDDHGFIPLVKSIHFERALFLCDKLKKGETVTLEGHSYTGGYFEELEDRYPKKTRS